MFSDWSGRKSFSNLIEPAFLGIAIIIAAIVRASFGLRFPECDWWVLMIGLCLARAFLSRSRFARMTMLPEAMSETTPPCAA